MGASHPSGTARLLPHRSGFEDLNLRSIEELDQQMLDEVERFFESHNKQQGKKFKLIGYRGPHRAEKLVPKGMLVFKRTKSK